jgi:hypothetical protein
MPADGGRQLTQEVLLREAAFALAAARDRWEVTEQMPTSMFFLCVSGTELRGLVDGRGLEFDYLAKLMKEALDGGSA